MTAFFDWVVEKFLIPFIVSLSFGLLLLSIGGLIYGGVHYYKHSNDPPPKEFSLVLEDWACTATHTEYYGKGLSREVCDQYTKIQRR